MKSVGVIKISISLLGILLTLALPNTAAVAQESPAILRFAPPALGLMVNTQGTVDILIENVQNLYGLQFELAFDPTVIEILDADSDEEGVQIKPADWWKGGFVAVNQVDNGSGRIEFAATLLRPALPVSGDRVAATITLAARKTGASGLSVESAILSTRNAESISYTKQAGEIRVNASGQEPDMQANTRSTGPGPGQLALAGTAILALLTALGVFIYVLRRR